MKFPKNRANVFLVERWTYENNATIVVGAFSEYTDAEDYKDACMQEWVDKGLVDSSKQDVVFNVTMTTYYG